MLGVQGESREKRTEWRQLLTLLVHLVVLRVRRVRVLVHLAIALRIDHATRATTGVLTRDLVFRRLVAKRRQLGSNTSVCWWLTGLRRIGRSTSLNLASLGLGSSTFPVLGRLALVFFLLLASLPLLANLLELCGTNTPG
jgi:hypothetical protein